MAAKKTSKKSKSPKSKTKAVAKKSPAKKPAAKKAPAKKPAAKKAVAKKPAAKKAVAKKPAAKKAPAKPVAKKATATKSPAKKPAAKKAVAKKAPAKVKAAPIDRNSPEHKKEVRARAREAMSHDESKDRAFFGKARTKDSLAEELGEEAVREFTSGEDAGDRLTNLEVEEERGGPFVTSTAGKEYAGGTDRANPKTATREPFPRT